MRKFDSSTTVRLYTLLTIGLMCIGFVFNNLEEILTFRSSLIQLHGTLRSANIYTRRVVSGKKIMGKPRNESNVSELVFYLNEHNKKFYLAENIGSRHSNGDYLTILKRLRRSDSVTVWIKKRTLTHYQPKIYQISGDNNDVLLELEKVTAEHRPVTAFLLVMGVCSIAFFFWMKYPDKFRKVFNG